ncbi:MFS transporter [Rouxiella silvae]|uniref:MFS transporter n=1 Tax=Rouxiella silvae TaxID=1646373 RepID=A0ABX3TX63_9GAMM|nr:MDR family MFS transporter [Rouxiella silvae]ORJ19854.1 MFS transporter [Rouxiella silvae]
MQGSSISPSGTTQIGKVMLPLLLVLFISTLDQTIVATALGPISLVLGNQSLAPWVATAYLLTSAVTTLLFGKLSDITGRKLMLQVSIVIFVVGSLLCAFAPTMLWLIVFRALQGIGGGGLNSLVMTVVSELIAARERARYQAILGMVPALAVIAGPVMGGFIVAHWDWMWIFMINIPVGVLAFMLLAARLHLPHLRVPRKLDISGGLLVTIFTTAILLLATKDGKGIWSSWILGLIAGLCFFAYLFVESRAVEPITPLHLFKNRIFSIASILFFLSTAVLFICMIFVPLMLQQVFGLGSLGAGGSIVPLLLGLIFGTIVSGGVITKTGCYKIFPVLGAIFSALGLYAMSLIKLHTSLTMIMLSLGLVGIGLGFFIQVTTLAGQNAVSHRELGVATGALNFFKTLGGAVGTAVFGAIQTSAMQSLSGVKPEQMISSFHAVYFWALPLMVIALILALLMPEKPLSEKVLEIAEGKFDVPEY